MSIETQGACKESLMDTTKVQVISGIVMLTIFVIGLSWTITSCKQSERDAVEAHTVETIQRVAETQSQVFVVEARHLGHRLTAEQIARISNALYARGYVLAGHVNQVQLIFSKVGSSDG